VALSVTRSLGVTVESLCWSATSPTSVIGAVPERRDLAIAPFAFWLRGPSLQRVAPGRHDAARQTQHRVAANKPKEILADFAPGSVQAKHVVQMRRHLAHQTQYRQPRSEQNQKLGPTA